MADLIPPPAAPTQNSAAADRPSAVPFMPGSSWRSVPGNPPLAVIAFLEDKKLLIGFDAVAPVGLIFCVPAEFVRTKGPSRRHHHKLGDGELDFERDGLEHRVIGLAKAPLPIGRLVIRRHEHAVVGVKRHHRYGIRKHSALLRRPPSQL